MTIQHTVAYCGIDKGITDQLKINNQWICSACTYKYDWNIRKYVPCTDEEWGILYLNTPVMCDKCGVVEAEYRVLAANLCDKCSEIFPNESE